MEHQVKGGVHIFMYPELNVGVRVDRISKKNGYIHGHLAIMVGVRVAFNGDVRQIDDRDKQQDHRRHNARHEDIYHDCSSDIVAELGLSFDYHL